MADQPQGPIGLAVKLPFATPEEFLARYGVNLTRGGIYLRSKTVKPPGTPVTLDLKLASGTRIIYASAVVHYVTGQEGGGVSGMGIKFLTVDPETQRFLDTSVASLPHAQSSGPPVPAGVGTPVYATPAPRASGSQPALANGAARASGSQPALGAQQRPSGTQPAGVNGVRPSGAQPALGTQPPPGSGSQAAVGAPRPSGSQPALGATAANGSGSKPAVSNGAAPLSARTVVSGASAPVPSAPPFEEPAEEPKRTGPVIGIDLGTTNSCASFVRNGKPAILYSREGYNTVPSILALNARGKLVVGHPAKGQMLTNPRLTVYGAKRLVGRSYESPIVRQIKDRFHYEIAPGPGGEAAVKLGDRIYSLQQISALILREVREIAQNQVGQPVSRAVITVPAYYNDNQRQAVREAGRLAGLHVERILNEPTAAALAYGYGRDLKQRVLVYDLGGGTFDASVLELNGNIYEVISTGGDTFLGGIDFDNAIVEHLLQEFTKKTGRPFQGDRVAMQRITDAAERAKCALSERTEMRIHVPFITMIDNQPYDLDVMLSRQKLIQLTQQLVDRTLQVCDEVLKAKGLTPKDIDDVILVGGQSRFPLVHEKITQFFGKPPSKGVHPDEAVAIGASLLANSLGQLDGVVLIDVLPMAIGIGLPGGRFKPVMERNLPLPSSKTYIISTSRDDQAEIELAIFQGESERAEDNEYLGTLTLRQLARGPRGSVKIEVTFEVSNECLLKVTAREVATGREVTSTFSTKDTPEAVRQRLSQSEAQPTTTTGPQPILSGVPPEAPAPEVAAAANRPGGLLGWFKRLFGRA